MRNTNTHPARAAIQAASVGTVALLGACSPHRASELTQSDQQLMLEEIGLGSTLVGYDQPMLQSTRPNLIAGDWLAIQCAQAGGYFDGLDWAPVYANVIATDYE